MSVPPVPYCSLEQFQVNSIGVDLSAFGEPELEDLLLDASDLADAFMQTSYQYGTRQEMQPWRGDWQKRWEVFPYYGPIRTVTSFTIAVSVNNGGYIEYPISVADNVPLTEDKTAFGMVFVDRDIGFIQTTDIMLKYGMGIAYLATPMNPPEVRFTYSFGYNAPTADPTTLDGLSFPFPRWLVSGTRHIAAALADEANLRRQWPGMGRLDSLKIGDRTARRATGSRGANAPNPVDFDIPGEARRYLKRGIKARFVGGH